MPFSFHLEARSQGARAGRIVTDHGEFATPAFMPVGTQASVKGVTADELRGTGTGILLANAYHLYLRPGVDRIERGGGLHRFMGWDGVILTDSGGYQVFSLKSLTRVSREGVRFRSHVDGSLHVFSPEVVMEAQARMGADILMSFDYFRGIPCPRDEAERSVELTTEWARRGLSARGARFDRNGYEQVVFGIVQGAEYPDLRARSLSEIAALDFPGYAIGGLSVGEEKGITREITEQVASALPSGRPRYLMGMGTPTDLVEGVARGIDLFDCVLPTRNARNGTVFTRDGRVVLRSTRSARARRAGGTPAPTCATCFCAARCWGRCSPPGTIFISTRT
jgi:queuine tRNA-ribosyltransferase